MSINNDRLTFLNTMLVENMDSRGQASQKYAK